MTRSEIARRSKLDRETIRKYLATEGAPRPNKRQLYNYKAVLAWVEAQSPKLSANSDEMKRIKESLLRMEEEDARIDLNVKRGLYVEKEKILPAIQAFCAQLTVDLRAKFEQELPPKCIGRTAIDVQRMNAEAIDWVLTRLKGGAKPIAA